MLAKEMMKLNEDFWFVKKDGRHVLMLAYLLLLLLLSLMLVSRMTGNLYSVVLS